MNPSTRPADAQAPHSGKLANDRNKTGAQAPGATHQGRRTPQSRSDRTAHVGSANQSQARQGPPGR